MKYRDLIKKFEKYADEDVSIVHCLGDIHFYPASDGDIEIVTLELGVGEPFLAREVETD